jgi:phage tail sheath protein FI
MLAYRTPGVYFEWLDTRAPALVPLRTDIAGFVGISASGPVQTPVKVESWTQFTSIFGGHTAQGYLAYSVEGFFANGGQTCWVVRAADPATAKPAAFELPDESGQPTLRLTAITRVVSSDGERRTVESPGRWGQNLTFSLSLVARDRFTLVLRLGNASEIWRDLSLRPNDGRYVERLVNDRESGSRLVKAKDLNSPAGFPGNTPDPRSEKLRGGTGRLTGGSDGLQTLLIGHFSGVGAPPGKPWGLATLEEVDEVSIVAMPDIMPKPTVEPQKRETRPECSVLGKEPEPPPLKTAPLEFAPNFSREEVSTLQSALLAHCLKLKDRFAVLDTRPEDLTRETVLEWRRLELSGDDQSMRYAALYFPWLLAPDPLHLEGLLRAIPPSGHVAGIYARGDRRVGVHKPPANEELLGVKDVRVALDDEMHGDLNEQGVNVIRPYRGRSIRVAGARTLCLKDPSWRYVNVRRLLIMIEEAIEEQTQWAVFEPNNPSLWREIDRVARAFLNDLWRRGMLDGATSDEAYSVRCDETTNPPTETEMGRLICEIGVQPPWPAEFVIVRIGKTEGSTEIIEVGGKSG